MPTSCKLTCDNLFTLITKPQRKGKPKVRTAAGSRPMTNFDLSHEVVLITEGQSVDYKIDNQNLCPQVALKHSVHTEAGPC